MLIPTDELGPAERTVRWIGVAIQRTRSLIATGLRQRTASVQLSPWLGGLCRVAAACGLVSRLGRSLGGGCVSWWQSAWMTVGSNCLPALRWSSAIASGVVRAVW